MDPGNDSGTAFFEWVFGAGIVIMGIITGAFTREAGVRRKEIEETSGLHAADNAKIWTALTALNADFQSHRGEVLKEMVRKEDLRETERRLTNLLNRNFKTDGD